LLIAVLLLYVSGVLLGPGLHADDEAFGDNLLLYCCFTCQACCWGLLYLLLYCCFTCQACCWARACMLTTKRLAIKLRSTTLLAPCCRQTCFTAALLLFYYCVATAFDLFAGAVLQADLLRADVC
jgi:hypothetical protein